MKFRYLAAVAGLASLSLAPTGAFAAPCAGFTDVDDSDLITGPFCTSVQWIRNRGVTVGCTPTEYCPNDPVTRLQMAAFMMRLGNKMTREIVVKTEAPGAFDLDLFLVNPASNMCKTDPYTVTDYPRTAIVKMDFSGLAAGALQMFSTPSVSVNGGTFQHIALYGMRASTAGATWQSMAQNVNIDLDVGTTYVFAVNVERAVEDISNPNDLTNSRCSVQVEIVQRMGATAPIDPRFGGRDNAY